MPTFTLIVAIVNQGYSEELIDAVRRDGARGGTIINARGTAREEAEKRFNIPIHPEKEIVLILAADKIVDTLLHTIYRTVGLETLGQGIAFTVKVGEVVGLQPKSYKKQLEKYNELVNKSSNEEAKDDDFKEEHEEESYKVE